MFTGIIQEQGTVVVVERSRGLVRLAVEASQTAARVRPLESVAVNGVCLSAISVKPPVIQFEIIPETQDVTTLGALRRGARVNLEPSLLLTDRLNGHVVLGHVDGVGKVVESRQVAGERILEIRVAPELRQQLVSKGPVTLDGVSLTVGRTLTRSTFAVHLIPETLRQTTLATKTAGERVNIEIDYLAKLVREALRRRSSAPTQARTRRTTARVR